MRADFIVPRIFRLVERSFADGSGACLEILQHRGEAFEVRIGGERVDHRVPQRSLDQVGKHLDVVASRAVSFGYACIDIVLRIPCVFEGEFGQELRVVGRFLSDEGADGVQVLAGDVHRTHAEEEVEVHVGSRIVMHLDLLIVQTQSHGERQTVDEEVVQRRLVVDGSVQHRRFEPSGHRQRAVVYGEVHGRCGRVSAGEHGVGIVFDHRLHPVLAESHRRVRVQPLVESAHSSSPLPSASRLRLHDDFLAQRFRILLLHDRIDILFREVLVEVHPVVEILESRSAAQREVSALVFQVHSRVDQIPPVSAVVVV